MNNVYVDKDINVYFSNIYQYIATNLALSGAIAYFIAKTDVISYMLSNTLAYWLILFSPLLISIYLQSNLRNLSLNTAQILYWLYGASIGASMSTIFLRYTTESIFTCFFITSSIFLVASIYGRTTSRNLSSLSSTLSIALLALIAASVINIFINSSLTQHMISYAAILIFSTYIAVENQQILSLYYTRESDAMIEKISIIAALNLYISFINIFISLLHLLGDDRRK